MAVIPSRGLANHKRSGSRFRMIFPIYCLFYVLSYCSRVTSEKLNLVESPFFLPSVTKFASSFETDTWPGTTFRVMGSLTPGLTTSYEAAQLACFNVGLGLAGAITPARKLALDEVIVNAERTLPSKGDIACCKGQYWVGGFRTGLSSDQCVRSLVNFWPYFTVLVNETGLDYNNCGKDPAQDWAWERLSPESARTYIKWTDEITASHHWERKEVVGPNGSNQPTGWNGAYRIAPDEAAGKYENCTAARTFLKDESTSNEGIRPRALNVTWWRDVGCTATFDRFVCEFKSEEQGVTADIDSPERNQNTSRLLQSPYYIPGVTDTFRSVGPDKEVYRVMGLYPSLEDKIDMIDDSPKISWTQAQQACQAVGGLGLATTNNNERSAVRNALLVATIPTLKLPATSQPLFWLGGASTEVNPALITSASGWSWYDSISVDRKGVVSEAETKNFNEAHWQWDRGNGFPSSDPLHVDFPEPSSEAPLTSCTATRYDFLKKFDRWENWPCDYEEIKMFICTFPDSMTGLVATDEASSGPLSGLSKRSPKGAGAIVAAVVGSIVVLLLLLGCLVLYRHRKRKRKGEALEKSAASTRSTSLGFGVVDFQSDQRSRFASRKKNTQSTDMSVGGRSTVNLTADGWHQTTETGNSWRTGSTYSGPVRFIGARADTDSSIDKTAAIKSDMHMMLDCYENTKTKLYGQYCLLGGQENRREGGQGLIVFVKSEYNKDTWAIKFFTERHHFDEERLVYTNDALQRILPEVRDIVDNKDSHLVAPNGFILPPFIVMDRGEPFDEWCNRADPDYPTALQVLMHVGGRLLEVHRLGYAHRDVKPSNVIWIPRTHQWVLIDFASTAKIGELATMSFSLLWAAPEIADACQRHESQIVGHGGLDVWSLGMMAWQLLTGESPWLATRAACNASGEDLLVVVQRTLLGRAKFPFEETLSRSNKERLGILRESVLRMLDRNQATRITIQELLVTWKSLFRGELTTNSLQPDHRLEPAAMTDVSAVTSMSTTDSTKGLVFASTSIAEDLSWRRPPEG